MAAATGRLVHGGRKSHVLCGSAGFIGWPHFQGPCITATLCHRTTTLGRYCTDSAKTNNVPPVVSPNLDMTSTSFSSSRSVKRKWNCVPLGQTPNADLLEHTHALSISSLVSVPRRSGTLHYATDSNSVNSSTGGSQGRLDLGTKAHVSGHSSEPDNDSEKSQNKAKKKDSIKGRVTTTDDRELGSKETVIERTVRQLRQQRIDREANMNFVGLLDDNADTSNVTSSQSTAAGSWLKRQGGFKGVWQRVKDGVHHTKMGFKLLWTETKIATGLVLRVLHGEVLSRREHKQLQRVLSDLFRLVPFSAFIIIPAGEVFLPLAIKVFPGLLPTQFRDHQTEEGKKRAELKVKIEMARFLQETVENMAVQASAGIDNDKYAAEYAAFLELLEKGRLDGSISTSEIVKFASLCNDVFTLDNMDTQQLKAMCRLLTLKPYGNKSFMTFQIRLKLRELHADDLLIAAEGVQNMSESDLQAACRERGMRAYGISRQRLEEGLNQWLKLHLQERVPASLLLLTRLVYLPSRVVTSAEEELIAVVGNLPDAVKNEIKIAVVQAQAGDVSPEDMFSIVMEQQILIEKEREEEKRREEAEQATREAQDRMHELATQDEAEHNIEPKLILEEQSSDIPDSLETKSEALRNLAFAAGMEASSTDAIEQLKEDVKDYQEELDALTEETGGEVTVQAGSANLSRQLEKFIAKLEKTAEAQDYGLADIASLNIFDIDGDGSVTTEELRANLQQLTVDIEEGSIRALVDVIDADHDGLIKVSELAKVFHTLMEERRDIVEGKEIEALKDVVRAVEKESLATTAVQNPDDVKQKTESEKSTPAPP